MPSRSDRLRTDRMANSVIPRPRAVARSQAEGSPPREPQRDRLCAHVCYVNVRSNDRRNLTLMGHQ
jgi:hypothetical protein